MNQLKLHGIYRHYKGDKYIVEDVFIATTKAINTS